MFRKPFLGADGPAEPRSGIMRSISFGNRAVDRLEVLVTASVLRSSRGETLESMGRNGCGKSTLAQDHRRHLPSRTPGDVALTRP